MRKIYRIHPAIGIARLGNSPVDYFIGPEAPNVLPSLTKADEAPDPKAKYKDAQRRIKRQGARFRVYEFTYDHDELKNVREITAADAQIEWSVDLGNRKAAALRFDGVGRRNPGTPIHDLIIDARKQTISGVSQPMKRLEGKFKGVAVPLGDLLTDSAGRLIVLGGFGRSQSVPAGRLLVHFANNDDWCDDTSDGPVRATVRMHGLNKTIRAESAWVIVAPPDFAPPIPNVITLWDVVYDVNAKLHRELEIRKNMPVSFTEHIYPILKSVALNIWVNNAARRGHGPETDDYFLAPELTALLANNSGSREERSLAMHHDGEEEPTDPAGKRAHIFEHLRTPSGGGGDMPMLNPQRGPGAPRLTDLQYKLMKRWAEGDFVSDWPGQPPAPRPLDEIPVQDQPRALDRAALDACVGAAFYPGIEAGEIMRRKSTYDSKRPLRISHRFKAGQLTEGMSVPWQADFRECSTNWWPAQRPNMVIREGPDPVNWVPYTWRRETMVEKWYRLGFVVKKIVDSEEQYVEAERNL